MQKTIYFLIILSLSSVSQAQSLFNIDAAGSNGIDGISGTNGADSSSTRGGDATDATDATSAEYAGDIQIQLKEGKSQRGVVVIKGTYDGKALDKKVNFGENGYIYLDASGGDGGDGGHGGKGGKGCDGDPGAAGSHGSDATQSSSGGNGESGDAGTNACDGGDGGNAGAGGDAGGGGDIKISVSESESHLMMLFRYDVEAGTSGDAGIAGACGPGGIGGEGGRGGRGGSSYSWTTSEYDGQDCSESCSLESNSNGTYSNSCTTTCSDRYRTEYHSNSGGYNGSDGADGADGDCGTTGAVASNGRSAQDGTYTVEVKGNDGKVRKYTTIFDLQLASFKFKSPHKITQEKLDKYRVDLAKKLGKDASSITLGDLSIEDGIFEPGETVIVYDIKVKNHNVPGKKVMPTPPTEAMVYLNNNRWVLADGQKLVVGKSLKPGEEYVVPGQLKFKIKDTTIHKHNERFRDVGTIQPLSYLTKVNRDYKNFNNPRDFEITYPIEITPLYAPKLMAPGQTARVFWRVKNLSTQDYGHDTLIGRKVTTGIKVGTDKLSQKFLKVSQNGVDFKNSFFQDITKLKPGASTLIEGSVKITRDAPYYTGVSGQIDLGLEHIQNPGTMKGIQFNDFNIKISRMYQFIEGVDFLVITNQGTTREEMVSWDALAKNLGLKLAVWDMSYYGFLDLSRAVPNIGDLRKDFARKTIVLLNNPFKGQGGQTFKPENLLSKNDFFKALNESLTSLYMVGTTEESFRSFLIPSLGGKVDSFTSLTDFHKHIGHQVQNDVSYMGYKLRGDYVHSYDVINTDAEDVNELLDKADSVASRLNKEYPHKNFMVIYNYGDQMASSLEGENVKKGDIVVKRIGGVGVGNAVSLNISEHEMKSQEFIHSPKNVLSIFMAMRFSEKLKYFKRLLNGVDEQGEIVESKIDLSKHQAFLGNAPQDLAAKYMIALIEAMLADLSHEHEIIRMQKHVMENNYDYEYELFHLRMLAGFVTPDVFSNGIPLSHETLAGQMLIRLSAGLRFVAETQSESGVGHRLGRAFDFVSVQFFDVVDDRSYDYTMNLIERFEKTAMGGVSPPRLYYGKAGKLEDPQNKGNYDWPEILCKRESSSSKWFKANCLDKEGDAIAFRNEKNWELDRENKTYSELSDFEKEEIYETDKETTEKNKKTYENFMNYVNLLYSFVDKFAERTAGCTTYWCEFFAQHKERSAMKNLVTAPSEDEDRKTLRNSFPDQQIVPLDKVLEEERSELRDERLREDYREERAKEKELLVPDGGE